MRIECQTVGGKAIMNKPFRSNKSDDEWLVAHVHVPMKWSRFRRNEWNEKDWMIVFVLLLLLLHYWFEAPINILTMTFGSINLGMFHHLMIKGGQKWTLHETSQSSTMTSIDNWTVITASTMRSIIMMIGHEFIARTCCCVSLTNWNCLFIDDGDESKLGYWIWCTSHLVSCHLIQHTHTHTHKHENIFDRMSAIETNRNKIYVMKEDVCGLNTVYLTIKFT